MKCSSEVSWTLLTDLRKHFFIFLFEAVQNNSISEDDLKNVWLKVDLELCKNNFKVCLAEHRDVKKQCFVLKIFWNYSSWLGGWLAGYE